MSTTQHQPPIGGTITAAMLRTIDELRGLARHGAVGGATLLTYGLRLHALACQLAVAEETLDTLADEAREQAHAHNARAAALADGLRTRKVLPFPTRVLEPMAVPFHDHQGGAA